MKESSPTEAASPTIPPPARRTGASPISRLSDFDQADVSAMQARVADESLDEHSRLHFHFALGKALEDAGEYARSFEHYCEGQRHTTRAHELRRRPEFCSHQAPEEATHARILPRTRAAAVTTRPIPIFIVGMPRAGSTLLEQILSSHPAVEGTSELPEILAMAKALRERSESADIASYSAAVGVDERCRITRPR